MAWSTLKGLARSDQNEISAAIHLPPGSPWFHGHFPGEPILPGVAQIGMVIDVIRKTRKQDLKVSAVRRVRFKQIIRPDDQLKIIAVPLREDTDTYSFRILMEDEIVCSGVVALKT